MDKRRREGERRVGLQWVYSGSTVAKGRTKDEGKTNKRRRKDESIPRIRQRKVIEILAIRSCTCDVFNLYNCK